MLARARWPGLAQPSESMPERVREPKPAWQLKLEQASASGPEWLNRVERLAAEPRWEPA